MAKSREPGKKKKIHPTRLERSFETRPHQHLWLEPRSNQAAHLSLFGPLASQASSASELTCSPLFSGHLLMCSPPGNLRPSGLLASSLLGSQGFPGIHSFQWYPSDNLWLLNLGGPASPNQETQFVLEDWDEKGTSVNLGDVKGEGVGSGGKSPAVPRCLVPRPRAGLFRKMNTRGLANHSNSLPPA